MARLGDARHDETRRGFYKSTVAMRGGAGSGSAGPGKTGRGSAWHCAAMQGEGFTNQPWPGAAGLGEARRRKTRRGFQSNLRWAWTFRYGWY